MDITKEIGIPSKLVRLMAITVKKKTTMWKSKENCPFFILDPWNGTDRLSRYVGKKLPVLAA